MPTPKFPRLAAKGYQAVVSLLTDAVTVPRSSEQGDRPGVDVTLAAADAAVGYLVPA